jgi:hypothetical protein
VSEQNLTINGECLFEVIFLGAIQIIRDILGRGPGEAGGGVDHVSNEFLFDAAKIGLKRYFLYQGWPDFFVRGRNLKKNFKAKKWPFYAFIDSFGPYFW